MIREALTARLVDYLAFSRNPRGKVWLGRLAGRWLDGTPVRSVYGPMLGARLADSSFWLAARAGKAELVELLADLGPDDLFVDVGANIGLATLIAAARGAAVISLEASPREFRELSANCRASGLAPLLLLAAADAANGYAQFRVSPLAHSGGSSLGQAHGDDSQITVLTVALDSLLLDHDPSGWPALQRALEQRRLVVKIDVEGGEARVLAGMARLLEQRRVRRLILEMGVGDDAPVEALLAGWGYQPCLPRRSGIHDQCFVPPQADAVPAAG